MSRSEAARCSHKTLVTMLLLATITEEDSFEHAIPSLADGRAPATQHSYTPLCRRPCATRNHQQPTARPDSRGAYKTVTIRATRVSSWWCFAQVSVSAGAPEGGTYSRWPTPIGYAESPRHGRCCSGARLREERSFAPARCAKSAAILNSLLVQSEHGI